jgi:hypothetical protein
VKREPCVKYANILGLGNWVLLSSDVENNQSGRDNPKILEDIFEAFIGAFCLEFGIDITRDFVIEILKQIYPNGYIDLKKLMENDDNYKDQLLQAFQARYWSQPKYFDLYHKKTEGNHEFCVFTVFPKNSLYGSWKYPKIKIDESLLFFYDDTAIKKFLNNYMKNLCQENNLELCIDTGKTKLEAQQNVSKIAIETIQKNDINNNYIYQEVELVLIEN